MTDGAESSRLRPWAIDDVLPKAVFTPTSVDELAAMMRSRLDEGIVVTCNGTKLDFGGTPSNYECQLDLSALPRSLTHSAGDLVVRVSANTAFSELQRALAGAGQRLSLDEVVANSSVGGVVATALSGPLRQRFGAVRDLLLGCSFVRADGQVAKAGGMVVKNVAGFDVTKLLCGSFGTLAVITECIFRLHPLPRQRHFISARLPLADAVRAAGTVANSTLEATAIEINDGGDDGVDLAVMIEGSSIGAKRRAASAMGLIEASPELSDDQPEWWAALPARSVVKIAFAPASAAATMHAARRTLGASTIIRGSISLGLLTASLDEALEPSELHAALTALRSDISASGGTLQVLRASPKLKEGTDLFGAVPGLELMARVKSQFDPGHRLGAGRFVGGW